MKRAQSFFFVLFRFISFGVNNSLFFLWWGNFLLSLWRNFCCFWLLFNGYCFDLFFRYYWFFWCFNNLFLRCLNNWIFDFGCSIFRIFVGFFISIGFLLIFRLFFKSHRLLNWFWLFFHFFFRFELRISFLIFLKFLIKLNCILFNFIEIFFQDCMPGLLFFFI